MSAAVKIEAPASIPVIDVSGLYSADIADRRRVADEIGRACDEIGFFYAVNHHVKLETIEAAWKKALEFFAQPMEAKLAVECDRNNRGYRKMGDTIHASGLKFARDSFDLGFPCKPDDPEVLAGTPLYAPNNWPALPGFEAALSAYYQGSLEVGTTILKGFALYLGQEEDFFSRHFTRPVADMVINHYYPYATAIGLGATETASGAHTDHGIITILWQDYSGGLQVMGKDGVYMDVPPIPGGYVINVGELMKRWTNGRFKATVHRVIHTKNAPRISMPLFCNPDFNTTVDPAQLGVEEAKYTPVTSGEFLISRFQKTRKLWGAANKDSTVKAEAIEAPVEA